VFHTYFIGKGKLKIMDNRTDFIEPKLRNNGKAEKCTFFSAPSFRMALTLGGRSGLL
jgi:hypothetical protein